MKACIAAATFAFCSWNLGSLWFISFSVLVAVLASLLAARISAVIGSTSGSGALAVVSFAFGGMLLAVVVLLVIGKFSVEEEVRRLSEGGVVGRGQRAR